MNTANDQTTAETPVTQHADTRSYRILFLEDNPDDVELMEHELATAGIQFVSKRTDKKDEFINTLDEFHPEIVLADYSLASFNGVQAFQMQKTRGHKIPFILVTGVLSEQLAVECLKEGIDDFILKSSFSRLPTAILNAITKKEAEEEKSRIASELKKSHDELRSLINRHQVSLEEERMTIARDLHDELGQVLTALKIDITMLRRKITSGRPQEEAAISDEFQMIGKTIDKIATSVKQISSGLRPEVLDTLGILEAIRWQAQEFERRNKIVCLLFFPSQEPVLAKDLSIAIFRIVQEALTNVARHSKASYVEINFELNESGLLLTIEDNGKGIDEAAINSSRSLGIIGLRERVQLLKGNFFIGTAKKGGTKIEVIIPML